MRAADPPSSSTDDAANYIAAETLLLKQVQMDSFPEEVRALKSKRPLPSNSRLGPLSPKYDEVTGFLRVGGSLHRAENLEMDPIVLDPHHRITKLLIQDFDESLLHPGPERMPAELRRCFWILWGREAIRKFQHTCRACQRWRTKPEIPKMADFPPARLHLYKPPF